jgi:peptide/nickel transport system substrate-binding protein
MALAPDRIDKEALAGLVRSFATGGTNRRDFVRRAAGLGLGASLVGTLARTYGASAAPLAPSGVAVSRRQDEAATPGGTFNFARAEDSVGFDPIATFFNTDIWIMLNVYEPLVKVAPSGTELEPLLAESWQISEDGLTYTFKLRSGVTFSDGTPLKASDVKFSLERLKNDPNQLWTFILNALETVEVPDDLTAVMHLNQPWAPFLSDLAMFSCSIIPEAWASPDPKILVDQMNGTGPFTLAEWSKGEYLLLKKNPTYWDAPLPYLDEVKVWTVPDDNNRILQLQGGEIQGMGDVPPSRVAELNGGDLQVLSLPSSYSQYIVFQHNTAPLDDVNARLALEYATDKQALIQLVLFGNGEEATSFMPRGALYWNDEHPGFPFNLDLAKEYLAKSATPDGFTVELQTLAGSAEYDQLAAALKDMWSQIGVDAQLAPLESSTFNDNFSNESFQAYVTYWTNDIIDPDELVAFAIEPASSNAFHTGWTNEEAVKLAAEGRAEMDPEKRKAIYFRIQEIFNENAVMGLLYNKPFLAALSTKVHNFQQPPTGQWVWKETWLEQ